MQTAPLSVILEDIRNGKPILLGDDIGRENEFDVVIACSALTVENLVFAMNCGGLNCIATEGSFLDRLQIPMMCERSTCRLGTPFTVSIDAASGITTGMSVHDRLETIRIFLDPNSKPEDLARPGHLFPLRARDGLLSERRGHTEGSVELVKLAGLPACAVIVEIMNKDGTMTRGDKMREFAEQHKLNIITIEEVYDAVYNKSV